MFELLQRRLPAVIVLVDQLQAFGSRPREKTVWRQTRAGARETKTRTVCPPRRKSELQPRARNAPKAAPAAKKGSAPPPADDEEDDEEEEGKEVPVRARKKRATSRTISLSLSEDKAADKSEKGDEIPADLDGPLQQASPPKKAGSGAKQKQALALQKAPLEDLIQQARAAFDARGIESSKGCVGEALRRKKALVGFMKRHLFYGIMGRDKSNIPTWIQFTGKQYTSKRQYIVACLQFFRKENFPDVSFAFEEKHRPEDILACLKRHVQDMKNVIRGVSMGKGRPGKGGKPADKELSLLAQKRLANERCLWTCPRCESRRTLSNKFCANCCHYRPWDEDAEDLDMSKHYHCTGRWKPESSSESSSFATSKSRRKSSSSSSASSGDLTTHMLTGKKQLKTIQYEMDDPGVYGQAKLIDRHPTHWTFSAYPHDRPLYAAEDPDRVPTGVTIYEADGSLFAWQPSYFGNSLYVNSVVGRQSGAAICLRVRVLCKDVWHGRKHNGIWNDSSTAARRAREQRRHMTQPRVCWGNTREVLDIPFDLTDERRIPTFIWDEVEERGWPFEIIGAPPAQVPRKGNGPIWRARPRDAKTAER
eukprot:g66732.t1